MPLVRILDPESAHRLAILGARVGAMPRDRAMEDPILRVRGWMETDYLTSKKTRAFGVSFSNPIGLAAGFDKHGEAMPGLLWAGFGAVEIGSVTPLPQLGNPRPRVFRLGADRAVINRYGFNSDGGEVVAKRLASYRAKDWQYWPWAWPQGVVGVNLGKNKEGAAMADYVSGVKQLGAYADYLVVNVSSPNTPNLRALQRKEELHLLMTAVLTERDALALRTGKHVPVLVKLSPDLSPEELAEAATVAQQCKVEGIIVSNTTIQRPATLRDPQASETGGLSGAPLFDMSTRVLADLYRLTDGRIPLIGVGGVSSGKDAYEKIKAGASIVQLYSSLVYEGPALVPNIKRELAALLRADGYNSVSEAVGVNCRQGRVTVNTPV